jgi:plasmid replication initiation protein
MHHARGYTLAGMTEKPTKRGPSERPRERTAGEPTDLEGAPDEGYGLLVMARHVKDDGRALIIYTRAGDPPE